MNCSIYGPASQYYSFLHVDDNYLLELMDPEYPPGIATVRASFTAIARAESGVPNDHLSKTESFQ
jgi:hypothetical protein